MYPVQSVAHNDEVPVRGEKRQRTGSDVPIDIVMGTYNGAKFLQEQIDSLLAQTHPSWRLLVRDDGSSDDTVSLVKAASKRDSRVHLVSDDLGRLGFTENFLHLLGLSNTHYVMFCDQDDVWLPHKIELTLREMLLAEGGLPCRPILVHCDAAVVDASLGALQDRFVGARGRKSGLSGVLFSSYIQGATSMVNAPLRHHVLQLKPKVPYDYHCGLIAAATGERRFLDQALMLYRQHRGNTIGAGMAMKTSGRVSPTLQLAIDGFPSIVETIRFFQNELSPGVAQEIEDFAEVLSGSNIIRRLFIALRRRYAFYSRRDRLNLLLYICNIRNI